MAPALDDAPDFQNINWARQAEQDEAAMLSVLADSHKDDGLFDPNRKLDQGEKDENAIDYEDLSDSELPDEEEATGGDDNPGLTDDMGTSNEFGDANDGLFGDDDNDDLFGEDPSSPAFADDLDEVAQPAEPEVSFEDLRALNFPEYHASANQDPNIPAPAESIEELIQQSYPGFEKGTILDFNKYLGPRPAHWIPKTPAKPPRALAPTKVSLDIAPDHEKLFRTAGPAQSDKRKRQAEAEAKGLVAIIEDFSEDVSDEGDFDYSLPPMDEKIKNSSVTWRDLEVIIADWDNVLNKQPEVVHEVEVEDEPMDDWDRDILGYSSKQKKAVHAEPDLFNIPRYAAPSFDNFWEDTMRLGKRSRLDVDDPNLLLERVDYDHAPKRQRAPGGAIKRGMASIKSRFNYSNDEAYDALKENHSHKVRAALGNITVEHSFPALKLQWPYYRTKLSARDARSWHRPAAKFQSMIKHDIRFSKPEVTKKRKTMSHMSMQEAFKTTKDLTLGDHYAAATLFEYSEEYPTVLSSFGMGNRVINYYRRKNADDLERPQVDDKVGETTVLLPEDQSPFSKFGMVDPGETVRVIHNAMYRAPIYKHEPKSTDFLVIRSHTASKGFTWYLRNIDNLFVVGQQLPLQEVPRVGSRRHTNAAKYRLRMFAYRRIRHHPSGGVDLHEMIAHIPGSTDQTNRQKLKEFLKYDKNDKLWKMRDGQAVPDTAQIRAMISPEDLCLIEAMQVGEQHLVDSGYEIGKNEDDDENDDNNDKKSTEQRLAPWWTTKNFIEAASGKAMLSLHGEGDPTGCGLGISMLKTSMKGGYQGETKGPNATSGAAMSAAEKKANGGHTYNVAKQNEAYESAIRTIWERQKANLSQQMEIEENDLEREQAEEDERLGAMVHDSKPSQAFDDSASQFSIGDQHQSNVEMRITRTTLTALGQPEETYEVVTDPRVWKEYIRRRRALDKNQDIYKVKETGDPDADREAANEMKKELERLERNKERRLARERAKENKAARAVSVTGDGDVGSPSSTPLPTTEGKNGGTTRKCANCGQTGHIKTNKKLCPNYVAPPPKNRPRKAE
ncbi:hypothetical protein B0O99DRAFT_593416 [Bisporella sp. PMI_857]|nr:hypothetical protein B0O99DRAFT_593416 [Bisporella sp. PMI_857]